ncbi:MAG: pyridoxal phosphate-dependent decarboxylase family protein [Alphaproteobacteria bacterium]
MSLQERVDAMPQPMPETGRPWPELKAEMESFAADDVDWRHGRNGMNVFFAGPEALQVAKEAYSLYMSENALNQAAFPSLKRMERDVTGFGLSLLNAPDGARANMTSGGTESILLAVKAARECARAERGLAKEAHLEGSVVVPRSAHPAFDKACHLLGLELIRVPVDPATLLADAEAMAQAVREDTFMVVGSAPAFPSGCIDPIAELGELAEQRNLWLHVDACVGGYFIPFAERNGMDVPEFDFRVPAVRSMSADLHKYGYCAKGASTVLYRSEDLWRFQTFDFDDWPCGRMFTPTLAGTRPGGAIASAWAVMNHLGVEGYRERARIVVETRERLEGKLAEMNLTVWGRPKLGLISFGTEDFDIIAVWPHMWERGWFCGVTTEPRGLHMMLTPAHAGALDDFTADLEACCAHVRETGESFGDNFSRYT